MMSGLPADNVNAHFRQKQVPGSPGSHSVTLSAFWTVTALFSIVVNVLMLVSPLYMLQVYDRVLTSGSVDTLIALTMLAFGLLLIYGFAEMARRRVMVLASKTMTDHFGLVLFRGNLAEPYAANRLPQNMAHLNSVQNFLANGLILPLFDLPFSPFFIAVMFLIHPFLGWFGLVAMISLFMLAVLTEKLTRKSIEQAQSAERLTQDFIDDMARQHSAIVSLGMTDPLYERWLARKNWVSRLTDLGARRSGALVSMTRSLRISLQISVLGLGAWLVLNQESSAGAIIAASIVLGRALAPIDQLAAIWRQYIQAHRAWRHLRQHYKQSTDYEAYTPLPRPRPELVIETMCFGWPGAEQSLLPAINSRFSQGHLSLVFGPTGCGKSTLLQTLSGAYKPLSGSVLLGSRNLHLWPASDRGQYIGYLPQYVDLIPGTIIENISRFRQTSMDAVFQAAKAAGCHELILSLPDGYDTQIGHVKSGLGRGLSAGQARLIGLARALFENPVLILLDEPSANLDASGVRTLKASLKTLRSRDTVILIATHDLRMVDLADSILSFRQNGLTTLSPGEFLRNMGQHRPDLSQSERVSL